jgi:hypothetical protein
VARAVDGAPAVAADALVHPVQLRLVALVPVALHAGRGPRRLRHGVADAAQLVRPLPGRHDPGAGQDGGEVEPGLEVQRGAEVGVLVHAGARAVPAPLVAPQLRRVPVPARQRAPVPEQLALQVLDLCVAAAASHIDWSLPSTFYSTKKGEKKNALLNPQVVTRDVFRGSVALQKSGQHLVWSSAGSTLRRQSA